MSINYISRPPFDSFTSRLFYNLVEPYSNRLTCVYLWTNIIIYPGDQHTPPRKSLESCFKKNKNVILGIKDHFTTWQHNPWLDTKPYLVYHFEKIFEQYPDTKFLILTSMENLETYIISPNVVGVVPWGGDITNQRFEYQHLDPVLDKNWETTTTFVSLSRSSRNHRTILLSLLYYYNLQKNGYITCSFYDDILKKPSDQIIDNTGWRLAPHIQKKILIGLQKSKFVPPVVFDKDYVYAISRTNDNVANFNNNLREIYRNSSIEFINETSMTEKAFLITEKTLNSIFGCNFPIFISSKGVVSFLRNIGMDVFDDVIDHSYDTINNPAERILQAISLNYNLLTADPQRVLQMWHRRHDRFLKNVEFAKTTLFEFYTNRAKSLFNENIKKLL